VEVSKDSDRVAPGRHRSWSPWEWSAAADDALVAIPLRRAFRAYLSLHATPESDLHGAVLIFGELLANVVRHAPGAISCHVDWHGEKPILIVLDEGAGFAKEPTTTLGDLHAESGRGLALVHALGMEIVLCNRPERGACVSVMLPVRRVVDAA
jgi:anti-sigma regulatory factor (Ser/Thr protein kinase)